MRRQRFFPMMALTNIAKNGRFYFPYLLTCAVTAAMFYIMCFIAGNEGLDSMLGASSLKSILGFGTVVVGIFAAVFLFYTNGFLMKRRQKELGLYNILGMEKRHIARVLIYEALISAAGTLAVGLAGGILLSKLMLLVLFRMIQFPVPFGFSVSASAAVTTACLFCAVFLLNLLVNLGRIRLARPIELLHGGQVGEREPKTKVLMTLVGVLALGGGYAIALLTESPLTAILLFFVAVLLVILGTFCLFTAGSVAVLKLLRKNKAYYYQTKHFIPVSGMLYRMKQNAAGLANICILSTMVLVMVSGTVSLYLGMGDVLDNRYPTDISIVADDLSQEEGAALLERVRAAAAGQGRTITDLSAYRSLSFTAVRQGDVFTADGLNNYTSAADASVLEFMTARQYAALTDGTEAALGPNEVLAYGGKQAPGEHITILGREFQVRELLSETPAVNDYAAWLADGLLIVLPDEAALEEMYQAQLEAFRDGRPSSLEYKIALNLDGTDEEKKACAQVMREAIKVPVSYTVTDESGQEREETYYVSNLESRQAAVEDFYSVYGGFLFLGVFLGALFLMATVLIIYYKQVSEGYEDKERFEILRKVGMSGREIRMAIRSQVLMVFFLPLLAAVVHIAAAFKMITKLLAVMNLTNVTLFFICTVVTVLVFGVVYSLVYALTARTYYRIVS